MLNRVNRYYEQSTRSDPRTLFKEAHFKYKAPHVKPPPKADKTILSPFFSWFS